MNGPIEPTEDVAERPISGLGRRSAAAGAAAAAVALGITELVAGFGQEIPSLISAVGDIVVDRTPGDVIHLAIDALGTADKPVLVWSIVAFSLAFGALIGIASQRRAVAGWLGFGGFALFGALAGSAAALASTLAAFGSALAGAAAGLATLGLLLGWAERASSPAPTPATASNELMAPAPTDARRGFLRLLGGAGVVAAGGALLGRFLTTRSAAQLSRSRVALPASATPASTVVSGGSVAAPTATGILDNIAGITPYITPNDDFYRIDTAIRTPQIDATKWSMSIRGMVDQEITLTLDDLLAEDLSEETVTIACVSNEVGGGLIGTARWTGVPLARLLERAGVQPGATQIVGRSVDGWTGGFPTELALDGRPAMVAVGMNGEPLPIPHGFPARLIVPGIYGYVSATKWLAEIELTTWEDFDGYWIPRGWSKLGPIKTQSRIDVPKGGFSSGPTQIAGVAWAVGRGIEAVEVRIDDGAWATARLGETVSDLTWVQWVADWDATPGTHRIAVRATDGEGLTQTAEIAPVAPDGATGYHTVAVRTA